ncbi:MAG: hypothetical protein H7Y17_01375 [Chlorobia bacterium]|nr:hypothetical protein [Fimbriimonadaceae bacterium]
MKARWILIPVLVGATIVGGYATHSAAQPPFAFISDLKGEHIAYPWPDNPDPSFPPNEYYGFRTDVASVQKALRGEMKERGWERMSSCFGGVEDYSELSMSSMGGIDWDATYGSAGLWYAASIPKGYTCIVIVRKGDTWLDRNWRALKKWMNPKTSDQS